MKTNNKLNVIERRHSTDFWYSRVISNITKENLSNKEIEIAILAQLRKELPSLLSVIMERACIFSCQHCIFQKECPSSDESIKVKLDEIIYNIIRQMPTKAKSPRNPKEGPMFIHEGRIIKDWHLDIFKKIRQIRPDFRMGLIDNGSYVRLIPEFKKRNFKLDWLDVSVDGLKKNHNLQRNNRHAFDIAMQGLARAREIVVSPKKGGRVTALFTITKVNFNDIKKTADFLFINNKISKNLIDEFHITTIAPCTQEHYAIETSIEDFRESWKQIKSVYYRYGVNKNGEQRIFIRFYRHEDIEKLAAAVGYKKFIDSLQGVPSKKIHPNVESSIGRITFYIDDVPVTFSPLSTWPQETFLIDADGANRVAHSLQYTLSQLQSGKKGAKKYTVGQLDGKSNFIKYYSKVVDLWWLKFGKMYLREEIDVFERIRAKANQAKTL